MNAYKTWRNENTGKEDCLCKSRDERHHCSPASYPQLTWKEAQEINRATKLLHCGVGTLLAEKSLEETCSNLKPHKNHLFPFWLFSRIGRPFFNLPDTLQYLSCNYLPNKAERPTQNLPDAKVYDMATVPINLKCVTSWIRNHRIRDFPYCTLVPFFPYCTVHSPYPCWLPESQRQSWKKAASKQVPYLDHHHNPLPLWYSCEEGMHRRKRPQHRALFYTLFLFMSKPAGWMKRSASEQSALLIFGHLW